MSTCRFVNNKGKFCGKQVVRGYPLCKTHVKKIQERAEKKEEEPEFVAPAYVPKYIYSNPSLSNDSAKPYRPRRPRNTRRDTEGMIMLGKH